MIITILAIQCNNLTAKAENGGNHGFACQELESGKDLNFNNGKPTVGVFYSTTCPACDGVRAPLNSFFKQYGDKVNCVSLNFNNHQKLAKSFNITQVPTTIIIDNDGKTHTRVGVTESYGSFLVKATGVENSDTVKTNNNANISKEQQEIIKPKNNEEPAPIIEEDFDVEIEDDADALENSNNNDKISPLIEEDFEEEDFLRPTDKALVVQPKDIEIDEILNPDELDMDLVVQGSSRNTDVMP